MGILGGDEERVDRGRVRRHERAELIQVLVPRRRRRRHYPQLLRHVVGGVFGRLLGCDEFAEEIDYCS